MAYILESKGEFSRLEFQEKISSYNISHDIPLLDIQQGQKIFDAGCGAGTVSRYISATFPEVIIEGCDASAERISQAIQENKERGFSNITLFQSSLDQIDKKDNSYDRLICRFVYEYLTSPHKTTAELYRLCRPGGKIALIDLDGVFFNLFTEDSFINSSLAKLKHGFETNFPLDLFVGRKLPFYLKQAGFKNIQYQLRTMEFKGEDISQEVENYRERFKFAHPVFSSILGEKEATQFERMYLEELGKDGNIIFYNLFTAVGEK